MEIQCVNREAKFGGLSLYKIDGKFARSRPGFVPRLVGTFRRRYKVDELSDDDDDWLANPPYRTASNENPHLHTEYNETLISK